MTTQPDEKAKTSIIPSSYALATATEDIRRGIDAAKRLEARALASRTVAEYAKDWARFEAWCRSAKLDPKKVSAQAVKAHLGWLYEEGLTPNTIKRAYTSIAVSLRAIDPVLWAPGPRPPEIRAFFQGLSHEGHHVDRKRAFTDDRLYALRDLWEARSGPQAARDWAILLVGFVGAFRRSELVDVDREDIKQTDRGLSVFLKKSKTDQEGKGLWKALPFAEDKGLCPVRAIKLWLRAAREAGTPIEEGPLFRPIVNGRVLEKRLGDRVVARVVKRAAKDLGLSPDGFAGHSLRAGFITVARRNGMSNEEIKNQTGHRRDEQLDEYTRHETIFERNAATSILSRAAERAGKK